MLPFPWEQHFRHFRGSWTPQPSSPPGRPCSARSGAFHYLTRALGDSFRTSKSRLRPWERQEEEEPSCGEQRALSGRCLCRAPGIWAKAGRGGSCPGPTHLGGRGWRLPGLGPQPAQKSSFLFSRQGRQSVLLSLSSSVSTSWVVVGTSDFRNRHISPT